MLNFDFTLKYFFLTIRPHPNDIILFEDFLILFFNFIKFNKNIKFSTYSIEKDKTPDRHLHIVLGTKFRDSDKLITALNSKQFKVFKERLKHHDTIWTKRITEDEASNAFINFKVIHNTEEDVMKTIGYTHKIENNERRDTTALENSFLTECIELYYAHKRNQIKEQDPETQSIRTLTLKNALPHILSFCKRNNIGYNNNTIMYKMVQSKYSFVNISAGNISRLFREFRIMFSKERSNDQQELLAEEAQNSYLFLKDLFTEDVLTIMRHVRDNEEDQDPELYSLFSDLKKKHRLILDTSP